MTISDHEVSNIARLARLRITATEATHYSQELTKILGFIEQIQAIDTQRVTPMAHPFALSMPLREDVISESCPREQLQQCAPLTEAGMYLVPPVLEE